MSTLITRVALITHECPDCMSTLITRVPLITHEYPDCITWSASGTSSANHKCAPDYT